MILKAHLVRQHLSRSKHGLVGIADSGISSLGNLVVSVIAARQTSLSEFGFLSATLLGGLIYVGLARALYGDPFVLSHAADSTPLITKSASRASGSAMSASLVAAPFLGTSIFLILLVSGAGALEAFGLSCALALVSPSLVVQDLGRTVAYAFGRPRVALLNSACWTALIVVAAVILNSIGIPLGGWVAILVWGSTSLGGAIIALLALRIRPRLQKILPWIRDHFGLVRRLIIDFAFTQTTAEASFLLILLIGGPAEAGLLRKAQIPLAPVVILTAGIAAVAQPLLVREAAVTVGGSRVRRLAATLAVGTASAALFFGLCVGALPTAWMSLLLGNDWSRAQPLVPFLTVYLALGAIAACLGIGLRALGQLSAQLRLRTLITPLALGLVCMTAGAGTGSAVMGLIGGVGLAAAGWAYLLVRTSSLTRGSA